MYGSIEVTKLLLCRYSAAAANAHCKAEDPKDRWQFKEDGSQWTLIPIYHLVPPSHHTLEPSFCVNFCNNALSMGFVCVRRSVREIEQLRVLQDLSDGRVHELTPIVVHKDTQIQRLTAILFDRGTQGTSTARAPLV